MSGLRRSRFGSACAAVVAAFSLMAGAMLLPAATFADQATTATSHPAHIHVGDCTAPGDVAAPLTNLVNTADHEDLSQSYTHVDLTLDDIVSSPHLVMVHLSDEEIGTYLACGDITNAPDENGVLIVGLGQVGTSGKEGVAILTANENGGTDVSTILLENPQAAAVAQMTADDAHPAHIHIGDCENPSDIMFTMTDIVPVGDEASLQVEASKTDGITASLDELTSSPHSIFAHQSLEQIDIYLVCGDIAGTFNDHGELAIPLHSLGTTGYVGVAVLHDNGDGTMTQWTYLMPGIPVTDGTPVAAATPDMSGMDMSSNDATNAVAVDIAGFAYNPDPLEVSVGTTVTWTNEDSAPHTVTADKGAFQSGMMAEGDTFSYTFTEAGTFDYHCEYHAGMTGTVIVK